MKLFKSKEEREEIKKQKILDKIKKEKAQIDKSKGEIEKMAKLVLKDGHLQRPKDAPKVTEGTPVPQVQNIVTPPMPNIPPMEQMTAEEMHAYDNEGQEEEPMVEAESQQYAPQDAVNMQEMIRAQQEEAQAMQEHMFAQQQVAQQQAFMQQQAMAGQGRTIPNVPQVMRINIQLETGEILSDEVDAQIVGQVVEVIKTNMLVGSVIQDLEHLKITGLIEFNQEIINAKYIVRVWVENVE